MASCGDVLSLEDLETAKKHQIFEAEVITGKQGGVAGGADIDYATNQVTGQVQKTMPAILRDLGFEPASFDFTTGGTLTAADRNKAVLWPLASGGDGDWYYWEGALPKVIPANSTPASTGGVANGAWRPVGDLTLREELAAPGGSSLIGDTSSTVDVGKIPKFGDTGGVATLLIPDNPGQRLFINKICTHADDFSAVQIARHANYVGGTAGYVGTAIQAKTYVEPTATATSEWTALFQLDNNAPNNPSGGGPGSGALPQNVAVYGQAQKRSTGSTWAACLEINDYLNGANGAAIGLEIACSTEGADVFATPQRNGVHVAVGELVAGGTAAEWGRGFWISTGANARSIYGFAMTGEVGDSVFNSAATTTNAAGALLRDNGSLVIGLDLSNANYSSSFAIKTKIGHRIGFDATGSFYLAGNAAVGGVLCNGNMQFNGIMRHLSANTSTTATAGARTLPANPGGFLNISVDGVNMRIPYYGA